MIFLSCILLILGIFSGDLWIKNRIEQDMESVPSSLWKGRILLRRSHNKGAMLNLGQEKSSMIAALSVALCLLMSICFLLSLGQRGNAGLRLGLSLLLGGSFSNTYDRLKRKYVVDYFSFNVPVKFIRKIVFNISDLFIMIGALITVLSMR